MFVLDPGIFLAALGITLLELAEASAVGLALFAESRRPIVLLSVAAGTVVVFIPAFLVAGLISYLPLLYVRLIGADLLLYFALRLARSARRSVVRSRTTAFTAGLPTETFERGLLYTGFSVGAVEAFEASVVLVGLLPGNYASATTGFFAGVAVVVAATYLLRTQVRKVKQANMKVVVSAILLTFSVFWFGESFWYPFSHETFATVSNDLLLVPLFLAAVFAVYMFANRPVPAARKA